MLVPESLMSAIRTEWHVSQAGTQPGHSMLARACAQSSSPASRGISQFMSRRTERLFRFWAVAILAGALSAPLYAHHSTSLYDAAKELTLTGTVSSLFWGNPHIYIELLTAASDEPAVTWSVVSGTPALNVRNGWKYGDVKVGDKVTVVINPARDGTRQAILDRITLADGRTIQGPREFLKKPT
jgi:hypothetical protein